jgi:hypothetical protein
VPSLTPQAARRLAEAADLARHRRLPLDRAALLAERSTLIP